MTADIIRLASRYGRYGYRRTTAIAALTGFGIERPADLLTESVGPFSGGMFALLAIAIWGFVGLEFACPLVRRREIQSELFRVP